LLVSFGANYGLVIAAAAVAIVAFAVVRGLWQMFTGNVELDAGGSWGRQATSRQRRSGEEMPAGSQRPSPHSASPPGSR
jgi:hypothetical protein